MTRKGVLPYKTSNNLGKKLMLMQASKIAEKGGIKVNVAQVEQEVADFCSVSRDTIVMIKRGLNQPSLPLALKIAKYFETTVEDIFKLEG